MSRFAVVLFLIFVVGCSAGPKVSSRPSDPGSTSTRGPIEVEIFDGVNARRAGGNLAALEWSEMLSALAGEHSDAMAAGQVPFGHAGIGARLGAALEAEGSQKGAENVSKQPRAASEVAPKSIERWLASDAHRKNMLGPYRTTGVGVSRAADGKYFVTQIFVQ